MTTLRWDPLLAIDSSQSVLSAEGGSGDKERFNSICCERLLAPHVNGISRLHSELHRREAQKRRREGQNYVIMVKSPFGPQRCDDNSGAWLCTLLFFLLILCHFMCFLPFEESSGRKEIAPPLSWNLFQGPLFDNTAFFYI